MRRPIVIVLVTIVLSAAIFAGGIVRYLHDNFEDS
jgi:hypothetical protein